MIREFKPFLLFAPVAFLFFGIVIARMGAGAEVVGAALAGMVYAGVAAFRGRSPVALRQAFPVMMLFLFLTGLLFAPSRIFTPTLVDTVQALLSLRLLLLLLNEIQAGAAPADLARLVLVSSLLIDLFLLVAVVLSDLKGEPSSLAVFAKTAHLSLVAAGATFFTSYRWIGLLILALPLIPGCFGVLPWSLAGWTIGALVLRFREFR